MTMSKQKNFFRHRQDFVTEELTAVLLERNSYEFNDLFEAVHTKLRDRKAASGGEEMLRLRVYEKLQGLVAQGLVKKRGKKYSANRRALRAHSAETTVASLTTRKRA